MSLTASQRKEYEYHCFILNQCDFSTYHKEKYKKRILQVLKRDGKVDVRAFEPGYRWNMCSTRLENGDFTNWDGWQFRSPWFMTFRNEKKCPIQMWDGRPVKHLVVLGEQGLGDEILFLSALPDLLVRYGKGIEWVGYEQLNPIVKRSFGIETSGRRLLHEVTEGDAVMASGDLFEWYRRDENHFPRKPFLKPDPEKVEHWKDWLKAFPGKKTGFAYKSRHGFYRRDEFWNAVVGDGAVFDLQYDCHSHDSPPFDTKNDFENLFAFVAALDRVISVTQTLVHIAGSLGKECHAIVPPKNGEIKYPLWYNNCMILGNQKVWPHLIYGSVKVYEDLNAFRNRSP